MVRRSTDLPGREPISHQKLARANSGTTKEEAEDARKDDDERSLHAQGGRWFFTRNCRS